jgi:hypothetical protein
MNFKEHYFQEGKQFAQLVESVLMEEIEVTDELSQVFVNRLSNYLEKCFPTYGDFNQKVGVELRQHMKGDNNQIKKMQQKIHAIINKEKDKFLRNLQNKCEKIRVVPKNPEVGEVPQND